MGTLTINPTYATSSVLYEADLDNSIKTPIETHFNNAEVEGSNIQPESITGASKLQNSAVITSKLANNAITSAKLEDAVSASTGILTAKIADDSVITSKILDANITTEKLNDLAVTSAKIGSNQVSKSIMLDIPRNSTSLPNTSLTWSSSSAQSSALIGTIAITGLTSGKPVLLSLESTSTDTSIFTDLYGGYLSISGVQPDGSTNGNINFCPGGYIDIHKDGNLISRSVIEAPAMVGAYAPNQNDMVRLYIPLSSITHVDTASSSSHTYSIYLTIKTSQGATPYLKVVSKINSAQLKVLQVV